MKNLGKIVVTVVAIVVFVIVSIFINAGTDGKAGWVVLALAAGLVAAIRAIWKKDESKIQGGEKDNQIDVFNNHKDINVHD